MTHLQVVNIDSASRHRGTKEVIKLNYFNTY